MYTSIRLKLALAIPFIVYLYFRAVQIDPLSGSDVVVISHIDASAVNFNFENARTGNSRKSLTLRSVVVSPPQRCVDGVNSE